MSEDSEPDIKFNGPKADAIQNCDEKIGFFADSSAFTHQYLAQIHRSDLKSAISSMKSFFPEEYGLAKRAAAENRDPVDSLVSARPDWEIATIVSIFEMIRLRQAETFRDVGDQIRLASNAIFWLKSYSEDPVEA